VNFIDIVVVVVVILFTVRGYLRGFINEIFSLFIIIMGLIISFLFYKPLSVILNEFVDNSDLAVILSFIVLFVFTSVVLIMIRNVLLNLIESLNFSDADSLLGLVIGMLKGALLCGMVMIFLSNHSILNLHRVIRSSFSYFYIEKVFFAFISVLPDKISRIITSFLGVY